MARKRGAARESAGGGSGAGGPGPAPAAEAAGAAPPAPSPTTEEEGLRRQLEEANRRAEETLSSLQRVAADYENFKRFAERERGEAAARERASLLRAFVDVFENLERAVETGRKELGAESALLRGLEMTLDGARELLEREGVRRIEALGARFDPGVHEAVCFVPDPGHPEYTVVEEVRRGYTLNGRVLRPSKVAVATGTTGGESGERGSEGPGGPGGPGGEGGTPSPSENEGGAS
ncbi:MAG: nucleotide exchange factor GrpE [Thermoplasmatota archaeon]